MTANLSSIKIRPTNDHQVEEYVLMWSDPTVNSTEEIRKAQQSLSKNFSQLNTYESVDKCENAIRKLSTTSRVILIISGTFGKELVPRIHDLHQILTIYVFCFQRDKYIEWAKDYNKVKGQICSLLFRNLFSS